MSRIESIEDLQRTGASDETIELLDGFVHQAASDMAANANNDGLEGQLNFLLTVAGWSDEEILNALNEQRGSS